MTRRSATFQEVAITHCPSSHLLPEPSYSVPKDIDLFTKEEKPSSSSVSRSRSFLNCVRSIPRMALRIQSGISSNRSIASSAVTINEYESSESVDQDSSATTDKERSSITSKGPLKHLKKMIKSASFLPKSPKSERRRASLPSSAEHFPTEMTKVKTLATRVDGWANTLKTAIEMDLKGESKEALLAYSKFNLQVTKDAIHDFELLTCDQQKLLNQVCLILDRRIIALKTALLEPNISSTSAPTKPCLAHDSTLRDLYNCLNVLNTIKTLGSKRKMPVVLVYRERRHRTHHRHQDKGKSNKIIFAKEKRDFLQIMGLPGLMITDQGIDFTVKPLTGIDGKPLAPEIEVSDAGSQVSSENAGRSSVLNNADKSNGEVGETNIANEIEDRTKSSNEIEDRTKSSNEIEDRTKSSETSELKPPQRIEKKMSLVDQFLGIRKRFSVSPQKEEDSVSQPGGRYRSNDNIEDLDESDSESRVADAVSTLSCDSCSSYESSVSSDVEEDAADTAVLANYSHRESLLPPPFQIKDETYIVFIFDKVGVKKAIPLYTPFLRLSIRDAEANLLSREQETLPWEIINENYLRSPSSVFVHETLEQLPEDAGIFMEMRHFIQEKRKISTLCYTFIEKSDIKQGEFICELYKPPVQFKRDNLVPYSEKAFFLHFEIKLETKSSETSSVTTEN